jgi:hypothetical protein
VFTAVPSLVRLYSKQQALAGVTRTTTVPRWVVRQHAGGLPRFTANRKGFTFPRRNRRAPHDTGEKKQGKNTHDVPFEKCPRLFSRDSIVALLGLGPLGLVSRCCDS